MAIGRNMLGITFSPMKHYNFELDIIVTEHWTAVEDYFLQKGEVNVQYESYISNFDLCY